MFDKSKIDGEQHHNSFNYVFQTGPTTYLPSDVILEAKAMLFRRIDPLNGGKMPVSL